MSEQVRAHYKNLLKEHGDSHLAGQYSSKDSQHLRFQNLLRCGDIENKSILDFGCGTAALADYISARGIVCDYYGYDFVSEFKDVVDGKFPWVKFISEDEFDNFRFDYIFVSGVFNNKINNNRDFYQKTIIDLFEKTKYCMSFNMMSSFVDYEDDGLFYENPARVFEFCKNEVTPFVSILNDYQLQPGVVPFEFACFLYKK